jgi:hypothetical protein
MSNALNIIRSLVIYSLCLPLAIYLGYSLAMPFDMASFTILVAVLFLPLLPVLLRWHHLLLFACWNTSMVLFFLPGRPNVWMIMTATSLMLSILQHILNRNIKFLSVPSVTRPLIFLVLVILITAKLTGGFGVRSMGGESMGGKRYFMLLGAIMGYFAMACYRVPEGKGSGYVALYLLGTLTAIVGSLAPFVDASFYRIFLFFPVDNIAALYGDSPTEGLSLRLGGLTFACLAIVCFVLARHGVRALFGLSEPWSFVPFRLRGGFGLNHPWRLVVFLTMIWITLMGGYRSVAIILALTFLFQFYFEGLFRTQLLPVLVLAGVLVVAISLPMVNRLPITIQRSLSWLPVEVEAEARYGAEASSEWRIRIWREVLPMVPQYLILGKGYAINPLELAMVNDKTSRTGGDSDESAIMVGGYHNGPLSVIIPLGIFGAIGFVWFLGAGFRALLSNFRHGDADLLQINTFLLSYFLARVVEFFVVFGSLYDEMAIFTGLVGLSVSLNGGLRKPAPVVVEKPAFSQLRLARATR